MSRRTNLAQIASIANEVIEASIAQTDQLQDPDLRAYGLLWNRIKDTYVRTQRATTLVANAYNAVGNGDTTPVNDFDTVAPWSGLRRCNLTDSGVVTAYYDDPTYAVDGSNGQVMVEIPLFYYKTVSDSTTIHWSISETQLAGYNPHPAFVRDGKLKSKIYIGAYEGNVSTSLLRSVSGVQPSTSTNVAGTIANFRTYAQARGAGWQQRDFLITSAIQLLYAVEYGSFDSQSTIGRGHVDSAGGTANHSINTGGTNALGNISGMASGTNGLVSVSYRGIENPWGNIWEFVDGINIQADYQPWVADHGFQSDLFSTPYVGTGVQAFAASATYYGDIHPSVDYGFVPRASGGSATSRFYDAFWTATGNRIALVGGNWDSGSLVGVVCWHWSAASSGSDRSIGGRVLFWNENEDILI